MWRRAGRSGSERNRSGKEPLATRTPGDSPAVLQGVEFDLLATIGRVPLAARGPGECEAEGPAVALRPLGDDTGDKSAIMFRRHHHAPPRGTRDVEACIQVSRVKIVSTGNPYAHRSVSNGGSWLKRMAFRISAGVRRRARTARGATAARSASALVHGYSVATAWATGMVVAGALAAALLMNATRPPSYP